MPFVVWPLLSSILVCPAGTTHHEQRIAGHLGVEWCATGDGLRHGPFIAYYPNGVRVAIQHFKDGVLDGPAEYSFNNGTIWRRDEFRDGESLRRWHNPAVAALSGDELSALGAGSCGGGKTVICGRRDKRAECRKTPPTLPPSRVVRMADGGMARGRYVRGARSGEWLFWDAQGNLVKRVAFNDGALGSYREWYPDGRPKTEGRYLGGEKWGTWRSWSVDGALEIEHVDLSASRSRRGRDAPSPRP
jgi:antitoxin component YwqK of YwqJK toxin-antitoxin module